MSNFLDDLDNALRRSVHYGEYDTDTLRALKVIHKRLGIHDFDGTATHAELLAYDALNTLFDHINSAELAHRFLNQGKTRQGAVDELVEEM